MPLEKLIAEEATMYKQLSRKYTLQFIALILGYSAVLTVTNLAIFLFLGKEHLILAVGLSLVNWYIHRQSILVPLTDKISTAFAADYSAKLEVLIKKEQELQRSANVESKQKDRDSNN